ncbi:MAG: transposase [Flavobacteriaceae bacterium]|nr:transposase [Flavobacteriaceae bacterium]
MKTKITKISATDEKISARGGLSLFLKYVENIKLYELISSVVLLKIIFYSKGLGLQQFLKQMFAYFIDGTDMSISSFDKKKTDKGYTAILENRKEEMASSHQIKRMFVKFIIIPNILYDKILHELFMWRLKIEAPLIIFLGIDTMVLDNDDSKKKEGCDVTYKKKKGFQPLHISWGPFLVDVLFRNGKAHSNHGTDYIDRVTAIVELIRKRYSSNVPIILCADSGFADQKAFDYFDTINVHFITTSKIYKDVKEYATELPPEQYSELGKGKAIWKYFDFASKRGTWKRFRRSIFTTLNCDENGQYILGLGDKRTDNLIITNIGTNPLADKSLKEAGGEEYFKAKNIVSLSHQRGADELIHRSIKELATKEQLPFKRMGMNRAYYFLLVISHFIFETYKRDVTNEVIPISSYPNTFRRKIIDFAAKITSGAGYVILNVPRTVFDNFKINDLWKKCQSPPIIQFG